MIADAGRARLPPVYECRSITVTYPTARGPVQVLKDVRFDVSSGEFVSLLGPSGTGKTTLLRVLCGLIPAGAGSRVCFRGAPVAAPPEGVAIVFQDYVASLLPWRTVEKNVALGLEGQVPRAARAERVRGALSLVGLDGRRHDYPWRLSGGMQQRVQIARALVMRPQVLLMDEPFGALDAMTRSQLQDELSRVHSLTGATIVYVTHDIDEAVYLSDRVLILTGSPASITAEFAVPLQRPRDQVRSRATPEFLALREAVHAAIHSRDGAGA
jgi:NitT/TauT family transport system ATP-binding protein